jgi:hypothetical protein
MSKEQTMTMQSPAGQIRLAAGILLLCFPFAMPPVRPAAADLLLTALWALFLAVSATEVLRRLPPFSVNRPPFLWTVLLLAPALPRVFPVFPPELAAAMLLLPVLLLLRAARVPAPVQLLTAPVGALLLTLWTGPGAGPALDRLLPGILFLLLPPLLCLRAPWRVFAIPFATASLALFFLILNLTPVTYWPNTAGMTETEARERAPGTAPAPRYRAAADAPAVLPGSFSRELVALIQERQNALSRHALHGLFENAPLPPEEMVRALRVYGFIQRDRHGYHIPSEAFTLDPALHLAEDYTVWVDKLRDHAGIAPESLDPELLREARRHEVLLPVRPGHPRLRFSANHRGRLDNDLLPRQILTLLDLTPDATALTAEAYARRWNLTLDTGEAELRELAELAYLEPVRRAEEPVRPPPVPLPDADRGRRILFRVLLFAAGALLIKTTAPALQRNLCILGGISLWGFAATELAAATASLPAAASLALWLTPVSVLATLSALKMKISEGRD